jgi:hypothetical protein
MKASTRPQFSKVSPLQKPAEFKETDLVEVFEASEVACVAPLDGNTLAFVQPKPRIDLPQSVKLCRRFSGYDRKSWFGRLMQVFPGGHAIEL